MMAYWMLALLNQILNKKKRDNVDEYTKYKCKCCTFPGLYQSMEKCEELAIISILPRSEVVNDYLKNKLLNHMFLISKFQKNVSNRIKNTFNEKEITFLVVNGFDIPDFGKKMIRIARQFPETALFIKGKTKGYCFLEWKDKSIIETSKSRDFYDLLKWNEWDFKFQDLNFLQPN